MTEVSAGSAGEGPDPRRFSIKQTHVAMVIANLVNRSGGAERIFVELANMLVARGYAVTCIHFEDEEGRPFYPLDRRVELINIFPRFKSERRFPYNMLNSKRLPDWVRQPAEWHLKKDPVIHLLRDYFQHSKPDVAISFLPPANTLTLLAGAHTGVKVIPTNHNVPERDYLDPGRWSTNPHDRKLRLKALRHAAAIHVLFQDFGEWFPEELQSKIVVIPNYISGEVLRHRPGEREKLILGVGRLAPVKNFMTLIEAWARLTPRHPDWRVVVYGDGPQRKALEERIAELGLGETFLLGGSRSDMGEVYARAAILCHPAEFEGFGLAPAEALALKMPVVAFADCPGVNQFVADGVNGLMVARESGAEGLAAALDRLMIDGDLRRRLGDNGPASVATFTEEHFANAWAELIERCLGRH